MEKPHEMGASGPENDAWEPEIHCTKYSEMLQTFWD